jgi:hypothetical protein
MPTNHPKLRIRQIFGNDSINLKEDGRFLSLEAEVTGCTPSQVDLQIDNEQIVDEFVVPYTLAGDHNNQVFNSQQLAKKGRHVIKIQIKQGLIFGPVLTLRVETVEDSEDSRDS